MRAVTYESYGPLENLTLCDVSAPAPGPGELVVDVLRAALNPKDSFFRKGRFALISGRTFPKRSGADFAGIVRTSRSPHFAAGDRVFGALDEWTFRRGTLADQVCVTDQEAARLPAGVSYDDAAAIALTGLTALQALRDIAKVEHGARVWIHGASGGVGTVAIQIARLLGAEVTTTSSAANLALCTDLGARLALDYRAEPVSRLRGTVDVVFDVFGDLISREVASVFDKRGVFISTVPTAKRLVLDVTTRLSRVQRRLVVVKPRRADLTQLGTWLANGELRAVIDSRFPIAQVHDAFRRLESKRTRGKIIVELKDDDES